MENRTSILQELDEISPVVAALDTIHPYKISPSYFETLPGEVIDRLKATEQTALPFISSGQKNPLQTPPEYFECLSNQILNRIRALDASSPKEELEALSPLLVQMDKTPPFSRPGRFFYELPSDVLSGIHAIDFVNHELETLPLILSAVNKEHVYKVPDNYFINLPLLTLNKVNQQQNKLVSPGFRRMMTRYAMAALITGAVTIAAWEFFQHMPNAVNGNVLTGINKISDPEKISDDEIVNYLEFNEDAPSENNSKAVSDFKEEEVKELLADLPDDELEQYLNQHAASKDLITNELKR